MTKFVLVEDLSSDDQCPNCWIFDSVEAAKNHAEQEFLNILREDGFDPDGYKISWIDEGSSLRGAENYPGPCAIEVKWYIVESEN